MGLGGQALAALCLPSDSRPPLWFQGPLLDWVGEQTPVGGAAGTVPSPEPHLECRGPRPGSRRRCLSHRGGGTELPGPILPDVGPLKPDAAFGDTVKPDKVDFVHKRVNEADPS